MARYAAGSPRLALTAGDVAALASEVRLACMRISRRVRFESSETLPPHQFSVLVRLEDGDLCPRELADIERVSAPSMTRTTGALTDLGLVARRPDPADGRQVIVSLTPQGRRAIAAVRRERDQWMHSRIAALSPDEQAALAQAVEILSKVSTE